MEQAAPMMKKEITLGQLLSVGVTLLITIITGWVTINNKVSSHEEQIKSLENRQTKVELVNDRIELKIDKINENIGTILVKLEGKKDRK